MDPTGYPTENHYTTLTVAPGAPEAPSDHVVWSICSFIHLNPCCLGLVALIFSIKARDRKVAGDVEGARSYGSTARSLNIAAMVIVSVLILIVIITLTAVFSEAAAYSSRYAYRG